MLGNMNRVALVLACGVVLAGCAAPVEYGPVAVYEPRGGAGDLLAFDGTIHISPACVTVVKNNEEVELAFPVDDVAWEPETQTLTYLGQSYRDGDPISLSFASDMRTDPSDFPPGCPVGRYYMVAPSASG